MTSQENPILSTIPFDGKRVIEIGSGAGAFTRTYLTRALEVVCIEKDTEVSQQLAAEWQANRYPARLTVIEGSFVDVDVSGSGLFDFAVFANSF